MIQTNLILGVPVPAFDSIIKELLDGYAIDGGGNTMIIGIENFENEIYRKIEATGMGTYMHVVSGLAEIGLKDVLAGSMFSEGGFDSRFVVTDGVRFPSETETAYDQIEASKGQLQELNDTERKQIISARMGQGAFRSSLIEYWKGCAVTESSFVPVLRASHIKPWAASSNEERLDHFNGLLLSPNLDAAFDGGFISFDEAGKILISRVLSSEQAYSLRIMPKLKIRPKLLQEKHHAYLEYHRKHILQGRR